jgi:hypothetical protein
MPRIAKSFDRIEVSRSGYYPGPWPSEDGGPLRLATAPAGHGLNLQPGQTLRNVARNTLMSTMTVLGAPGEVYLLTHSAIRSSIGLSTTAQVERIDPLTLRTLAKSPRLAGGPMWPGGMAVHANGDLYVVYGRYAHRLGRDCGAKASLELPLNLAYNSFVILDNGLIVTKNLSDARPARLTVIDPESMRPACADIECSEPSIARLSASGGTVYVVGVRSIFRHHWDGRTLAVDPGWRFDYIGKTSQSHGWDAVLDGSHAWFIDNGKHRYVTSMVGRGVRPSANRLIRVSIADAQEHQVIEICGAAGGSVTNPPLVDVSRKIVVGFDSANRQMRAWRYGERDLVPLWRKNELGCASHMILEAEPGHLITNDYRGRGEEVVVLDIRSGAEIARTRIGGLLQGVVFPSVGWNRDLYWCSMTRVARVFVE